MEHKVRLVNPSVEHRAAYMSFYREWKLSGEDMVPWVIGKDPSDFDAYLEFLFSQDAEEKIVEAEFVPHSTYWLMNDKNAIVGAVNIRHRLNERLLNAGGHIGYGIRPSERRKGYAAALLALSLEKMRQLGVKSVLVVCDKGNVGSERTILKNGGRFESEFTEPDGNIVRRFWIDLDRQ